MARKSAAGTLVIKKTPTKDGMRWLCPQKNCRYTYPKKNRIIEHYEVLHQDKRYKCTHCGKEFPAWRQSIKYHMQTCKENKDLIQKASTTQAKDANGGESKDKEPKKAAPKKVWWSEEIIKAQNGKWKCPHPDCSYNQPFKSLVKEHYDVLHKDKKFSCHLCGRKFAAWRQSIKDHMKVCKRNNSPNSRKNKKSKKQGKENGDAKNGTVAVKDELPIMIRNEANNWICPFPGCGYFQVYKHIVVHHYEVRHLNKEYKCPNCSIIFPAWSDSIKHHMNSCKPPPRKRESRVSSGESTRNTNSKSNSKRRIETKKKSKTPPVKSPSRTSESKRVQFKKRAGLRSSLKQKPNVARKVLNTPLQSILKKESPPSPQVIAETQIGPTPSVASSESSPDSELTEIESNSSSSIDFGMQDSIVSAENAQNSSQNDEEEQGKEENDNENEKQVDTSLPTPVSPPRPDSAVEEVPPNDNAESQQPHIISREPSPNDLERDPSIDKENAMQPEIITSNEGDGIENPLPVEETDHNTTPSDSERRVSVIQAIADLPQHPQPPMNQSQPITPMDLSLMHSKPEGPTGDGPLDLSVRAKPSLDVQSGSLVPMVSESSSYMPLDLSVAHHPSTISQEFSGSRGYKCICCGQSPYSPGHHHLLDANNYRLSHPSSGIVPLSHQRSNQVSHRTMPDHSIQLYGLESVLNRNGIPLTEYTDLRGIFPEDEIVEAVKKTLSITAEDAWAPILRFIKYIRRKDSNKYMCLEPSCLTDSYNNYDELKLHCMEDHFRRLHPLVCSPCSKKIFS